MAEPSANPNVFAAPTEGFGQTVSFAFDPRGEVPQQRPVNSQGPRVNASGVSGTQRYNPQVNVQSAPDPTAQLLMKAGGDILAKELDAAQNAEYIAGMQRAMSGEALADVKESVPWYAKIFGDTPVIEGARAYTAQDTVNRVLTRETSSIRQLEQLGPEDAGKHFANVLQNAMTGDKATDGIVMKQMVDQMPALMKAQAKAHYAYGQRKASAAMTESMLSGGVALQQFGEMFAADQVSEQDMKLRAQQYVQSVLPPAGIDEESYQKTVTSAMLNMAQTGNFHALGALKDTGILGALTAEQSTRIEAAITSKSAQARNDYAVKYSRTIAEIKNAAAYPEEGSTPAELEARIDRANDAFRKLTGSPEPLFTGAQKTDLLTGTLSAYRQEEIRQQRRAETLSDQNASSSAKEIAQAETDALVAQMVSQGDINLAKKLTGVSSSKVDLQVYAQVQKDPQNSAEFLKNAWAKGYVSDLVSAQMVSGLKMSASQLAQDPSAPPNDTFFQSVLAYRSMEQVGGKAFANAYFGDYAKEMSLASYLLKDNVLQNPNAGMIYHRAMNVKNITTESISAKEKEDLVKQVTSEGSSWLPSFLGGYGLREDAVRAITADVSEGVSQWMAAGLAKDEATAMAISDALGTDAGGRTGSARGELLGGFYIQRDPASGTDTLSTLMEGTGDKYVAIPKESRGEIFKDFMKDYVKIPDNAGTVRLFRQLDAGGTARFVVNSVDKDGMSATRVFTSLQLQEFSAERVKKMRKPKQIGYNRSGILG